MTRQKVIKVGLDFDGVVTYNPFRVARTSISFVKHHVLKIKKLGFFVPKNRWQRFIYYLIIIFPSAFPANGVELLKQMARSPRFEFYLLTGRFDFARGDTANWLKKNDLTGVFKKIYINLQNEQPHEFKRKVMRTEKFDYYVEDNWDIVQSLGRAETGSKILWIYNMFDLDKHYKYRFPYLEKALQQIIKDENSS